MSKNLLNRRLPLDDKSNFHNNIFAGAGKSSFFNGIESAFEGHVTGRANAGEIEESLTTQVTSFILQHLFRSTIQY